MQDQLEQMREESLAEVQQTEDPQTLDAVRVKYLGRKGKVTEVLRGLSQVPAEERPALGQAANHLKQEIAQAIDSRRDELQADGTSTQGSREKPDLTLPGRKPVRGHHHVIAQVLDEIVDILGEIGFQVASGPDVENEYYNFDSLNTPDDHPARDSHDTFYLENGYLLRTHTSPVQMRVMESQEPPVAIIAPGRAYRVDLDASHVPNFFQIEGLLVDEGVSFADLKGTLGFFVRRLFGEDVKTRFRPHFFPFTEPSAEMDVSCTVCAGKGCRVCKYSGWLEILGCGMVHPEVFRYAGYDYEKWTGFAFGLGIDRIALLRHAIDNLPRLYENDVRFLEQF